MNYVIAVLSDRTQAEAAAAALKQAELPPEQVHILGKGYTPINEFDFLDPRKQGRRRALLMSFWLVPFGFIAGVAFNLSTQYQLVPSVGTFGNQMIGGLLGAIGGAMGSFFVGGGAGLSLGSGDAVPYGKRLQQGKYLVIVSGTPNLTNKATSLLRQLKPEHIQGYVDPTRA
jgi:hypothetical protein